MRKERNDSANLSSQFALEVEFIIKIEAEYYDAENKLYNTIKNKLKEEKREFYETPEKRPLELYVRYKVKEVFKDSNFYVSITNYYERKGSFIFSFSILIITAINNYGTFHDNLDKLRKDFYYLLGNIFPSGTFSVDYFNKPNPVVSGINAQMTNNFSIQLRRFIAVIFFLVLLSLSLSLYTMYQAETIPLKNQNDSTVLNTTRLQIDLINKMTKANSELFDLINKISADSTTKK